MKPILILLFLGVAFLFPLQNSGLRIANAAGQDIQLTPAQEEANQELNRAADSYRKGDFVAAQQHSERAEVLDPLNKNAPFFIARTIHAQYKPRDPSEANIAKAREALEAYKRILVKNPQNEEAFKAVAYLYNSIKEEKLLRQWVLQRATDQEFSAEKRAEAYVVLASKDWDCSFKITELPTNKVTTIPKRGPAKIEYIRPSDPGDFEKARQCATNGLSMADEAISLNPESEAAWSYKTNLLIELSKLAEMDNDPALKTDLEGQLTMARSAMKELIKRDPDGRPAKP